MKIRDAFKLLNTSEDASPEEIKKLIVKRLRISPDVNSSDNAQAEFECIQSAYTLIQAYIQYKESEHSDKPKHQKPKSKKDIHNQKQKKQWFEARIQYDISVFKHSKKFILSRIIAILRMRHCFWHMYRPFLGTHKQLRTYTTHRNTNKFR